MLKHYPTIALITLALSNLSLQALLVYLRGVSTAFTPGGPWGWLEPDLSPAFLTVACSVGLLVLTYSRLPIPGKQLVCFIWIAASAALANFYSSISNTHLFWLTLISTTGVWIAHTLLVFGRWHFGTEIDLPSATPAKRRSLFSLQTLLSWLPIATVVASGYLLLIMIRGPWPYSEREGMVGLILNETSRSLLGLPFILPLLARRHVWFWYGFSATAVFVCILALAASQSRPPPSAATTVQWLFLARGAFSFIPLACNTLLLRLIGFRWTETEPWPKQQPAILRPAPSPFD